MSITPSTPLPPVPPSPPRPVVPVPPAVSSFSSRLDRVSARTGVTAVDGAPGGRSGPVAVAGAEAAMTLGAMLRAGLVASTAPVAPRGLVAPSVPHRVAEEVAPGATVVPGAGVLADRSVTMPVDGRVSSTFGPRVHPIHGGVRDHHGLDVAAPTGTPVRSLTGGTVVRVGDAGGYGLLVEVDHGDGVTSRYAHLSAADVGVGDELAPGEVLGAVGSTGASTGPHLHLEVRVDGAPVDPELVLAHA